MLAVDRMNPHAPSPQEDTTMLPNHLEEERRQLLCMEKFGRGLDIFKVVPDHPPLDESTLTRMDRFTNPFRVAATFGGLLTASLLTTAPMRCPHIILPSHPAT
jgi:hypothetical protein